MTSRVRIGVPLATIFILSLTSSAWACLWYYGTGVHGEPKSFGGVDPTRYVGTLTDHSEHQRRVNLSTERLRLDPAHVEEKFKALNDLAATLVYKGEAKKAIELLTDAEKEKPGEYVIAANLGTAYELHGDLPTARHWIAESIRRNREAHYGTEWLHLLILDARMALAKDPAWLRSHSVLGVDFGKEPAFRKPTVWPEGQDPKTTLKALEYQLHERMGFVRPPDQVVGDLLCDLGNVLATSWTIEHAIAVYDLALSYKPPQADLIGKRRDHLQGLVESRHRRELLQKVGWIAAGVLFLGFLVFCTLKRRRTPA